MIRSLVTQMLVALQASLKPVISYAERSSKAKAAITAAREYLATEPSGERAELISRLAQQWAELDPADPYRADVGQAVDMLEADAQQANKPTGWDNGLSQDYCAEFGQWLASRPGARQQIKAMFDEPEEEDLYTLALKADNWGQP